MYQRQTNIQWIALGCRAQLVEKCFVGERGLHTSWRTYPGWFERSGLQPMRDRFYMRDLIRNRKIIGHTTRALRGDAVEPRVVGSHQRDVASRAIRHEQFR